MKPTACLKSLGFLVFLVAGCEYVPTDPQKEVHRPEVSNLRVNVVESSAAHFRLEVLDGEPADFEILENPTRGRIEGAVPSLRYTPEPGYIGSDSFRYRALRGGLRSDFAVVELIIAARQPSVTSVVPAEVPYHQSFDAQSMLTLTGSLLTRGGTPTVDGRPCEVESRSDDRLICRMPQISRLGRVEVHLGGRLAGIILVRTSHDFQFGVQGMALETRATSLRTFGAASAVIPGTTRLASLRSYCTTSGPNQCVSDVSEFDSAGVRRRLALLGFQGSEGLRAGFPLLSTLKALQYSGKLLVVGAVAERSEIVVYRLESDGTPDATFGEAGRVVVSLPAPLVAYQDLFSPVEPIQVLEQGSQIVLAAHLRDPSQPRTRGWAMIRLLQNGRLDIPLRSFALGEGEYFPMALADWGSNRVVVMGFRRSLDRYESILRAYSEFGSIERGFGTDGTTLVPDVIGRSLYPTTGGGFLAVGDDRGIYGPVVWHHHSDGRFNAMFARFTGRDGFLFLSGGAHRCSIQLPDGNLVLLVSGGPFYANLVKVDARGYLIDWPAGEALKGDERFAAAVGRSWNSLLSLDVDMTGAFYVGGHHQYIQVNDFAFRFLPGLVP